MSLGNVPPDVLAGALEKLLAKMDESDLAISYQRELATMPSDAFHAFVEAMFAAFRERGESSEDAAEGAGTTLENIARRERSASEALIAYARGNPDLLKETTSLFVQRRPDFVAVLPALLREALAERFTSRSLS
jgi:transcriptional regulator